MLKRREEFNNERKLKTQKRHENEKQVKENELAEIQRKFDNAQRAVDKV